MSTTIQHKLTDLEIAPPKGSWDKIAAELDDSASGMQFPSRLNELALTPPASAWTSIVQALDLEIPANAVAAKMLTAEAIPPASTWDKIETALDEEQTTIVPLRRIPAFIRYAAAAVLIGFIAFGTSRLINTGTKNASTLVDITGDQKSESGLPVGRTDDQESQEELTPSSDGSTHDEDARNDAALEASKKTYAKLDVTPKKKVDAVTGFNFASLLDDQDPIDPALEEGLSQVDALDNSKRYIVLMTPDGHFIRMSKKLSNLLCCVSGEEEDVKCRTQIDKWRKQIACSPTPHPGNFMDILSLLGTLQDN